MPPIPLTLEEADSTASVRPVRSVELELDGRVRRLTSDQARQLASDL